MSGVGQKYGGGGWVQSFDLSNISSYRSPIDAAFLLSPYKQLPYEYDINNLPLTGNINLSDGFDHSLEVNDLDYSDGDDDYWLLLGGSDVDPNSDIMQETDASQQLICKAQRIKQGDYGYVIALFTEQNILGEWNDTFLIKEIGLYKGSAKPAYGATLETRKVIEVPNVVDEGYVVDLITPPSLYRAPVKFLRNSQFTVTFGHTSSGT